MPTTKPETTRRSPTPSDETAALRARREIRQRMERLAKLQETYEQKRADITAEIAAIRDDLSPEVTALLAKLEEA